ncbi:hypothetical protein HZU73_01140 [Apis mellifera caucasica]|nr:hypothetical protein HZU73_01140 [Apis mellifera caucasica]KAG9429785.1 hypothetical protein HZU67_09115 [Apis mellifera carnica]
MRYINSINKEDKSNNTIKNEEEDINKEKEKKNTNNCISKEDLLLKLKSLIIKEDNDDFDINNKFDSDSE